MALDQFVSPHTGVRTIQNTGVFWQVVFQPPRPYALFLEHENLNPAPTQYRQQRRLQSALSKETTRLEPQTSRSLIFIIANTNSTLSSLIIEVTRATANIKVYDYSLKFCW